jgi:hypothetical protein
MKLNSFSKGLLFALALLLMLVVHSAKAQSAMAAHTTGNVQTSNSVSNGAVKATTQVGHGCYFNMLKVDFTPCSIPPVHYTLAIFIGDQTASALATLGVYTTLASCQTQIPTLKGQPSVKSVVCVRVDEIHD